jgi:hypothetical protein
MKCDQKKQLQGSMQELWEKKQMSMELYAKVLHKGHLIGQCL